MAKLSIIATVAGFLWFWPLLPLLILFFIWRRHAYLALLLAGVGDIAYGPPPAHHFLHLIQFPLLTLAVLIILVRVAHEKYIAAGKC